MRNNMTDPNVRNAIRMYVYDGITFEDENSRMTSNDLFNKYQKCIAKRNLSVDKAVSAAQDPNKTVEEIN